MIARVKQILANLFQNYQGILCFELDDCESGHVPFKNLAKSSCMINVCGAWGNLVSHVINADLL